MPLCTWGRMKELQELAEKGATTLSSSFQGWLLLIQPPMSPKHDTCVTRVSLLSPLLAYSAVSGEKV